MTDDTDSSTAAGVPSDNTTLLSVLEHFRSEGWTGDPVLTEDGPIRCASCREEAPPDDYGVGDLRRLEGASDPDDMLAVVAVRCPNCGDKGTLVLHYGPTASPAEAEVLLAMEGRGGSGEGA